VKTEPVSGFRSPLGVAAIVTAVVILLVLAENAFVPAYLMRQPRLTTDFSPAYLRAKLKAIAAQPPAIVFLGDSAIWGYGLPAGETAISLLAARGCPCVNLAFKAGSPANDYALVRLFAEYDVRPKLVVIEINQRPLNHGDDSYNSLHPAIASLAAPLFTAQDRAALNLPTPAPSVATSLDRVLASTWQLYAMRADLRSLLLGDVDALPKKKATADQFLGTYDLTPLDETNVGVKYLEKTVDLLRERQIPMVAFMTPTNHVLLHDYIDDPAYAANGEYLKKVLAQRGVRTIDLDRAFPTAEFIDNAHLTAQGQIRLAAVLSRDALGSAYP
jgi:hypothetical protein